MSKQLTAVVLAVGAGIGMGRRADPPPERFARYVEHGFVRPGLNDLAPLLHVQQYQGRVELTSGFRHCKLVLAAYKDGKPVHLPGSEEELLADAETSCTLRYGVQVADLDYLPLGGGKKGHCRLRFTLQHPDGATSALERDVPKDLLDLSQCSNLGFNERAATNSEVPLFWLKVGGTIPGPTVPSKELVESKWAKDGAVLIVSLRFNDRNKDRQ
jgi:hypothetical protein